MYFIMILLLAIPATAAELMVIAEDNAPFSFTENGKTTGFLTDLFHEMSKQARIPIPEDGILILPWARGYGNLQSRDNVILFPTARIAERENLFQWIGPIMTVDHVLIALKGTDIDITDIKNHKGKHLIAVLRQDVNEQFLLQNGTDSTHLKRLNSLEQGIRMLKAGRVDAMAYNGTVLAHTIRTIGFDPDEFKSLGVLSSYDLYYAASKNMPTTTVRKLQEAIDQLKVDGRVNELIHNYLR